MSITSRKLAGRCVNAARGRWLVVVLATAAGCGSRIDAPTATSASTSSVQSLSIVLQPGSLRVSPGGSGVTIGTIHGAPAPVVSYVVGVPNSVSVRVTTATITAAETTVKYIFFASAGAVPGSYPLGVRVVGPGGVEREAQLTLVVALDP